MFGSRHAATMLLARKVATMIVFGFWLMAGVAIGMILIAFLAIGAYQRGYAEGYSLRKPWRAELGARRSAVINALERGTPVAAAYRMEPSSLAEALPPMAAAS